MKPSPITRDRVFIIAEAGSNWRMGTPERDLEMARTLIEIAAEAGADAVKFQTYRAETVYVPEAGESGYLAASGIRKSINDIFDDLAMPHAMLPELAAICRENGVQFMSTPFSVADAEAVDPFVAVHKVASYEINHVRLLEYLAATGKPLILSTGAAGEDDIRFGIDVVRRHGAGDFFLMQCTARYPAPMDSLNLRVIPFLRERFGLPAGFSDHSRDPVVAPVAAVALGARIIEKHFTLHNRLPGADHPFAVTPEELRRMVAAVRQAEEALGMAEKQVDEAETELRHFAVRALQAIRDIQPDEVLVEDENFAVLRPGNRSQGLSPRFLDRVAGRRTVRFIGRGEGITRDAVEGFENEQ